MSTEDYSLPEGWSETLVVPGQPVVQKNSKIMRVIPAVNMPPCRCPKCRQVLRCRSCGTAVAQLLVSNAKAQSWRKRAVAALLRQWRHSALPKHLRLNAAIVSFMQTRRLPDASNLYQGPEDALQHAGVLEDDVSIESHEGSRRDYDKNNPRVEITLSAARAATE